MAGTLTACLLASCGGGGEDSGGGEPQNAAAVRGAVGSARPAYPVSARLRALLERAPASTGIFSIDVAATRRALSLPPDADAAHPSAGGRETTRKANLSAYTSMVVAYFGTRSDAALRDAIDHRRVQAAITAFEARRGDSDPVTLVATDEPPASIRRALVRHGFLEQGALLVSSTVGARLPVVALRDGMVVVAHTPAAAASVVRNAATHPLTDVLEQVPGPVRGAETGESVRSCVRAIGVGDRVAPATGDVVVATTKPDAHRSLFGAPPGLTGPYGITPARARGSLVRTPYEYHRGDPPPSPVPLMAARIPEGAFYRCD